MPRKYSSGGKIMIVCPHCGFLFSLYETDEGESSEKYMGSPILSRSLAQYDDVIINDHVFRCPKCGVELSFLPRKVAVMKLKKFKEKYVIDRIHRTLMVRSEGIDLVGLATAGLEAEDESAQTAESV